MPVADRSSAVATDMARSHLKVPRASLPSTQFAVATKWAPSWRGKYLRALNITPAQPGTMALSATATATTTRDASPEKKMRAMRRPHRCRPGDHHCHALSRSYSSAMAKEEHERAACHGLSAGRQEPASTTAPCCATSSCESYGFARRPGLSRGRRCHTDPFVLEQGVPSAPIEIPSARTRPVATTSRVGTRDAVSPVAAAQRGTHDRLLSWEEPLAMRAAADAVTRGWTMAPSDEMAMALGVREEKACDRDGHGVEDDDETQDHDRHEEDESEEDDDSDHGDDIFEMEGVCPTLKDKTSRPRSKSYAVTVTSRRRSRTSSLNVPSRQEETRRHYRSTLFTSDPWHGKDRGTHKWLSESFVPPHELIERDCFSIGLRDEFKRRVANQI